MYEMKIYTDYQTEPFACFAKGGGSINGNWFVVIQPNGDILVFPYTRILWVEEIKLNE